MSVVVPKGIFRDEKLPVLEVGCLWSPTTLTCPTQTLLLLGISSRTDVRTERKIDGPQSRQMAFWKYAGLRNTIVYRENTCCLIHPIAISLNRLKTASRPDLRWRENIEPNRIYASWVIERVPWLELVFLVMVANMYTFPSFQMRSFDVNFCRWLPSSSACTFRRGIGVLALPCHR